jgi:hypothetical protein
MEKSKKSKEYYYLFLTFVGLLAGSLAVYKFILGQKEKNDFDIFMGIVQAALFTIFTISYGSNFWRLRKQRVQGLEGNKKTSMKMDV